MSAKPKERLWLGNDGKYQVRASYVCLFQDKKVKLQKTNGAMVAIPLNFLCDKDRKYIALQSNSSTKESKAEKKQQSITETFIQANLTGSSTISGDTLTVSSSKVESPPGVVHCNTESILQKTISPIQQNVRYMSPDGSTRMIPKRSLLSIKNEFKRQSFLPERKRSSADIRNLANIPSKIASSIASYLDFRSRLRLSTITRRVYQIVYKPEVWTTVFFHQSDRYLVNDEFYYQMVVYLQQRGNLQKFIKHVNLDSSMITSASVMLSIKYLENLNSLSVQSCWQLFTYRLATDLTNLSMQTPIKYASNISKVTLGKVLHRGPTGDLKTVDNHKLLDSKSFGQDAWFMNAALNKLAKKNVIFDVVLCGTCHVGASLQEFLCVACGILPLKKCVACSPRCDRCGSRTCGLPTCADPKVKVQVARCGRCEATVALCNNDKNRNCQEARKPCNSCNRVFHVRCRTTEGNYITNQCTRCGIVACPSCDLFTCTGGCHSQWCKKCVPTARLNHCKCIIIQGKADTANKSMAKRVICGRCQKSCNKCGIGHFCDRCVQLHSAKCA